MLVLRHRATNWLDIFASPVRAELCTIIVSYLYDQREDLILPPIFGDLAGVPLGSTTSLSDFARFKHHLWRMAAQMIRDDSWDLIPDTPSNQLLQPTPKSCPLRRPEFDLRSRFPAAMHVSARTLMCDTRFQCSGPRLTLAGISTAAPTVVPGYEPIRSGLSHHVSHVACPYERYIVQNTTQPVCKCAPVQDPCQNQVWTGFQCQHCAQAQRTLCHASSEQRDSGNGGHAIPISAALNNHPTDSL